MTKRPISVIVIACLYIAIGVITLTAHLANGPLQSDLIWIALTEVLAIVAGAFLFFGANWARWLAIVWIAFHVVLSAFHARFELLVHSVLCVAIAYALFRSSAREYFRAHKGQAT
jgi:hypothetical protein